MSMSATTVLSTIPSDGGDALAEGGETDQANGDATGAGDGQQTGGQAPVVEPPKPDQNLELAKRFDKVGQREAHARRRDTELSQRESKLADREKELQAKLDAYEADFAEFDADPVTHALKKGKDPTEIVKRSATPKTPQDLEIEKIKAERAQEKKELADRQEKEAKQREEHSRRVAVNRFVSEITRDNSPHVVAMYDANDVPAEVDKMLGERLPDGSTLLESFRDEHGRNPSNQEIRQALEHRATNRARATYEALKQLFEPAQVDASASPPPPAPQATSTGPSISNQHAGKVVSQKPQGRPLTLEEKRARSLQGVRTELEAEPE